MAKSKLQYAKRPAPGRASKYFHHFEELVASIRQDEPDAIIPVLLYCRVSTDQQWSDGNLDGQESYCLDELKRLGVKLLVTTTQAESGKKMTENDRPLLAGFFNIARDTNAVIVAESVDRFIRHEDFDVRRRSRALPTDKAFKEFMAAFQQEGNPVRLATLLHPDTPLAQVEHHEQERGKVHKGNRGGRKPKSGRPRKGSEKKIDSVVFRVIAIKRQEPKIGCRTIEARLRAEGHRVGYRTICKWLQDARAEGAL